MPELVKHSSQDLHCDLESQHAGAHPEISNRDENTDSFFTKYFELEEMFEKTCYPIKSEKEGSTMRLDLSKQEFYPSLRQHTEVRKGISEVVNDQQVQSTLSSINNVQLKDESCCGDLRNNAMPESDDNDNQISLNTLNSGRESGSKDRVNLEKEHHSRKVLTPRDIDHRKKKYVEEQNESIKERQTVPVKAPIKEAWTVNKPNKRKTTQVGQEKMAEFSGLSACPENKAFVKDSEIPNLHKLSRKSNTMCCIVPSTRSKYPKVKDKISCLMGEGDKAQWFNVEVMRKGGKSTARNKDYFNVKYNDDSVGGIHLDKVLWRYQRQNNTMKDVEVLVKAPADVAKQAEFSNNGDTEASKLDDDTPKETFKSLDSHGQVDTTDASFISESKCQEAVPEEVPINAPLLHPTTNNNSLELSKSRSLKDMKSDGDAVYNTMSAMIVQRKNITNSAVQNKISDDGDESNIIRILTSQVINEEYMDVVSTSVKTVQPPNMGQNAIKKMKLNNGKVLHLFLNKNSKISIPPVNQNRQNSGTAESVASNMHSKGVEDLNILKVSKLNLEDPLEVDTDNPAAKDGDGMSFDFIEDFNLSVKKGMELKSIDNDVVKERGESAVDTRVFTSADSLVPIISPCQATEGIIKEPEILKAPTKVKMKMLQDNYVNSVIVINGKSFDFRCTICKELPRKLNRSELYRHYATQHFQKALTQEFGHHKVCPYCNIELKGSAHHWGSVASHFGQKHSFVESYLPVEAWIPDGWRKTSGEMIRKKNKIKEPLRNEKCMWPEDLAGFDIDGPGSFKRCQDGRSTVVAIVDGFEIEHEKEIETDQVQVEKRFAIDKNEVVECRICKRVFEDEQASVMHLQESHGISVSGDVNSLLEAFLTTGYMTLKQRSSVISYSSEVTADSDPLLLDEEELQLLTADSDPLLLDEEELQLLKELNAKA